MWLSQHNRSRHAFPHARFVRSSAICLMPEGMSHNHLDGAVAPKSATDGVQLVVYMRKFAALATLSFHLDQP